ncbi:MAG: alpha/beta fold hydrolase [Candidatus Abyssubacteria bacterium]
MPHVRVNDVNLNYEQSGTGETIVFLHGYTGSSGDWANQVPVVSVRYRAIAIDHRGHGKSDAPPMEEAYSINIFSEDVYALLGKLGIARCCLVGHSMGGFIALQFVLDHPEIVKALVLVDTSSGEFEVAPGYAELRAKLDEVAREKGMEAAFQYDAEHNPVRIERFKKHPELREVTRRKMMNTSVDGYIYVARTFRKWRPVTDRLGEIRVPTLIFLGEEDAAFVNASRILNEGISGSELVTIPGVGHSPHEESPQAFNDILLPFLSKIAW